MLAMNGRGLALGAGLLMLLASACKQRPELSLKDSEGRSFRVSCDERAQQCALKSADGAGEVSLRRQSRLLGVCPGNGDAAAHPADCRAIMCNGDGECPPAEGAAAGSCIDGWCVDPSHKLTTNDAVMLCLAGTGLGHDQPKQVERYALGLNCGEPCVIPAPCKRP